MWSFDVTEKPENSPDTTLPGAGKGQWPRTHVDDDVERVVVGQKDANTAAVLHGFVVVEVQSVHLRVAGTGQAPLPATGARGPTDEPPARPPTAPVVCFLFCLCVCVPLSCTQEEKRPDRQAQQAEQRQQERAWGPELQSATVETHRVNIQY